MCLGDIRFMPHVRWTFRSVALTGNPFSLLNRNPNRVGILMMRSPVTWGLIPTTFDFRSPASFSGAGFQMRTDTPDAVLIDYQRYGDLVQQAWTANASGVDDLYFGEATVPGWVMEELQRMADPERDFDRDE